MSTNITTELKLWTPVKYGDLAQTKTHKALEKVDEYFNLGGRIAAVVALPAAGSSKTSVRLEDYHSNFFFTVLKVISYATLIIPTLMFIAKVILRLSHSFTIAPSQSPLRPELQQPLLRTQEQQREDVHALTRPIFEAFQAKFAMAASDQLKTKVNEVVTAIPVEERAFIVPMIGEVVLDSQQGFDASLNEFVNRVINRNVLEKGQAIEFTSLLTSKESFVGWMARQRISSWMSTFEEMANIPPHERNQIKDLILLINGYAWNGDSIRILAPIPAGERENVVLLAMQLITPDMHYNDIFRMIQNVAAVPVAERAQYVQDRLAGIHQNHAQEEGVNVHEGDRDQRVNKAIALLRRHQGEISLEKLLEATAEFIKYLEALPMDTAQKQLARDALLKPRGEQEGFGPFLNGGGFTILGQPVTGEELIGRLWIFASQLKDIEQANAKRGMISALQNSYENTSRVCNQGKAQRLIVAVLQGRLNEVDIDRVSIPKHIAKADAMELFFTPERRKITVKAELLQAADKFCNENPGIDREEFLVIINAYASEEEMPES